jgi:hypothetical protein
MGWFGVNGEDFLPAASVWRAFAADPDVVAVNDTPLASATVNGHSVWVFSHQPVASSRPLPVVTLSGHMPWTPGEIALAPDTAREIKAKVGDTLTFAGTGQSLLRVTGIAFVPDEASGYAKGAWITGDGFRALFPGNSFAYHQMHVTLRPGADAATVIDRATATLARTANLPSAASFGFLPAQLPRQAQQLHNIRTLPLGPGLLPRRPRHRGHRTRPGQRGAAAPARPGDPTCHREHAQTVRARRHQITPRRRVR